MKIVLAKFKNPLQGWASANGTNSVLLYTRILLVILLLFPFYTMKKATEKLLTIIEEQEKNYDFNDLIKNYIDIDELEEAIDNDSVQEYLEELNEDFEITDTEIMYYYTAIQYLAENDQSLRESMEIASEYGYETWNLNSELLASLLKSKNNQNDYAEFIESVVEEFTK